MQVTSPQPDSPAPRPKRFYASLSVQVSVAIAIAILFGYLSPARAVAMKPLGDAFIRLITMIVTLIIFCTVVTGIAGMQACRCNAGCQDELETIPHCYVLFLII